MDVFPDTMEGMVLLQQEIERNHPVQLTQLLQYISHPDERQGKAASTVMIALKSVDDYQALKYSKIIMLYEH
jgi:hypothetical protein